MFDTEDIISKDNAKKLKKVLDDFSNKKDIYVTAFENSYNTVKKNKKQSAFFYSKGKFSPPYFWITMFLIPVLVSVWAKIIMSIVKFIMSGYKVVDLTETLILGLLGFVAGWLVIYNWQNVKRKSIGDLPKEVE